MAPPCAQCGNPLRVRVNLSSEEISAIHNDLSFEFGPFVVTPEKTKEVRAMLALADKDIEEHELQVARITEQLSIIQTETIRLKTQRATLMSLLSPMRKLPNETLLRIFQHVCEEKENLLRCYPWLSDEAPPTRITSPAITYLPTMAISSVCSRWRALALSSPSLWANLKIEIYTATIVQAISLAGFTDTVSRYVERSGDWPLKISLNIRGDPKAEFPSLVDLTLHSWRWKTFIYQGTDYGIFSQLRFPLLEELDLGWTLLGDSDRFGRCPKLHALSTPSLKATSRVLYNQLDHLRFTNWVLVTELIDALQSCSHLKSFKILGITTSSEYADLVQGGLGTWPNIASLSMDGSSSDTVFSFFNFPSLNNLEVYAVQSNLRVDTFISFVSRSSCIITTFTLQLQSTSLSDMDLIAALRVMPALLHLKVDQFAFSGPTNHPITSHLISALTHHRSTSISLVPHLHSLHLTISDELSNGFDAAAFVSMVQSRWFKPGSDLSVEMLAAGRSTIRSVVLKFSERDIDADIYEPLRILDAEGLRVVVAGWNGIQV